jgi:hypothetical protein
LKAGKYGDQRSVTYFLSTMLAECKVIRRAEIRLNATTHLSQRNVRILSETKVR